MKKDPPNQLGQRGIETEELDLRSLKKRRSGTGVWLLLIALLIAAIAAFLYFEYLPMRARVAALEGELDDAREAAETANAELEEVRAALRTGQEELERLRSERESLTSAQEDAAARAALLEEETNALRGQLEEEISRGEILLRDDHGRLTVALADRVLFPSGRAELNERGQQVLRRIADSLRSMDDKVIQVGGHSDNVAIPEGSDLPFSNNWELSSARATEVVRFLQEECEIPGERLVALGYNEYRPVASNRSPSGRRRNRRIDLVLAPQEE